jgi:hypothetical protein
VTPGNWVRTCSSQQIFFFRSCISGVEPRTGVDMHAAAENSNNVLSLHGDWVDFGRRKESERISAAFTGRILWESCLSVLAIERNRLPMFFKCVKLGREWVGATLRRNACVETSYSRTRILETSAQRIFGLKIVEKGLAGISILKRPLGMPVSISR